MDLDVVPLSRLPHIHLLYVGFPVDLSVRYMTKRGGAQDRIFIAPPQLLNIKASHITSNLQAEPVTSSIPHSDFQMTVCTSYVHKSWMQWKRPVERVRIHPFSNRVYSLDATVVKDNKKTTLEEED